MSINVGDKIPSVTLTQLTPDGVKEVTTDGILSPTLMVMVSLRWCAHSPSQGALERPIA